MNYFSVEDRRAAKAYEFWFEGGELVRLHSYDMKTGNEVFDQFSNPEQGEAVINVTEFEIAVMVLAYDSHFDRISEFIDEMKEGKYKQIAREAINNVIRQMEERCAKLSKELSKSEK